MALSEFSFELEFIAGVDNNIADAMSRLCRNNMIDYPEEFSKEHILSAISMSNTRNNLQYSKVGKMHNSAAGHFSVERTLKRFIDKEDIWKFQRHHIKYFIENCPCCQIYEYAENPHCSAMHHFPSYKTNDPDLWNCITGKLA